MKQLPVFLFPPGRVYNTILLPRWKASNGLSTWVRRYSFAQALSTCSCSRMINHQDLFIKGFSGRRQLAALISKKKVKLAGNRSLKIYGTLHCASGKRMKTVNRVFFAHEQEALAGGYRPCGCCMRSKYLLWKGK